jgi:UDP-glucose 4-epimerase
LFRPAERFRWNSESEVKIQITAASRIFATRAAVAGRWEIYWAAGVGNMSSAERDLERETRVLGTLLTNIQSNLRDAPGALAFASSAGAIYAGSHDYIINENTNPAPTTAYAYEKIRQEDMVSSFARDNSSIQVLLARLSTIYGPGQSTGKQQGLIAHIARCMLGNHPIKIFVPFDTIRDYVFSDDAATMMVTALRAIQERSRVVTKIIASEHPTTIAEIISLFKRIKRRAPRIITSANRLSRLYPRCVRFRSIVICESAALPKTSLPVGIAQLMAAEQATFARSSRRA